MRRTEPATVVTSSTTQSLLHVVRQFACVVGDAHEAAEGICAKWAAEVSGETPDLERMRSPKMPTPWGTQRRRVSVEIRIATQRPAQSAIKHVVR